MKIDVDIEKKHFFGILLIGLITIGIAGVIAYNNNAVGGNPANFGHSVDEVDWSKMIKGNISAEGICIGTDCRASWPSGGGGGTGVTQIIAGSGITISPLGGTGNVMINATGGGGASQWTTSGNDIYYNGGNISTTNFMKATGVCINASCKGAWPATGFTSCNTHSSARTFRSASIICNSGEIMTGGGIAVYPRSGESPFCSSYPSGNGWAGSCSSGEITVYVRCCS
jgi:hypothetical protein